MLRRWLINKLRIISRHANKLIVNNLLLSLWSRHETVCCVQMLREEGLGNGNGGKRKTNAGNVKPMKNVMNVRKEKTKQNPIKMS